MQKWLALGVLIGVVSGLGAVVFYESLVLATHFFLTILAGYQLPTPIGEGARVASSHFARPWALPLIAGVGALLGALLVYWVAPDAEGHGTDAAIDAVHRNPRGIRFRTVIVKIVASALTIGSGGSGGREGPTGQISAGFGSFLARFLDLTPSDARIAVASGIGSGIGSFFGAPLGGSILATEIMYRDDFEVEALLPAFIASITGYIVFGSVEGFGPLFGYASNFHLRTPSQLLWFAIIGILGGLFGLLYSKVFYQLSSVFERSRTPRWVRPALAGVIVGAIGIVVPEVLGTGYGWIQVGLSTKLLHIPLWIILLLPLLRIVATGLSIGSGGSGGIFGPGMVIGAFIGAAVWRLAQPEFHNLGHSPAPYVIVGMMCCFGSISRAPLAVMLMVAEMTGSLSLLVPAMVAVGIASLLVRRTDDSIYRSQPRNRSESPAHQILSGLPLLATVLVGDAMVPPRCIVHEQDSALQSRIDMEAAEVRFAIVVDDQRQFVGVVSLDDLVGASDTQVVSEFIDTRFGSVRAVTTLDKALETVTTTSQRWAPVLDDRRHVEGTLSISDIVGGYRKTLQKSLDSLTTHSGLNGVAKFQIETDSPLIGMTLRESCLPKGVLVTAIQRGASQIVPNGNAKLRQGDRLTLVGGALELNEVRQLALSKR